jgi:hypothetical protein
MINAHLNCFVQRRTNVKTATKLLIVTLLLALIAPTLSFAADDTALRSKIEEMLIMTKMDKMMEPMYAQLESMLQSQVAQMGISEEQEPIVNKYNSQMFDLLRSEMSWENMRDQYIDLYAKVYTIDEIETITAFYSSEIGQKMLDKMPQLMQESMSIAHTSLQTLYPKIQSISQQMMAEIQASQQSNSAPEQ